MKNLLILLPLCFAWICSSAQNTGLEGKWVGDHDVFMFIADSSKPDPDINGSFLLTAPYSTLGRWAGSFQEVFCQGDTLRFRTWYEDTLERTDPYDLLIVNQTDTTLVALPVSEGSIQFF